MEHKRKAGGHSWTDYETNTEIAKEINITQILEKTQEFIRNWLQYVNRVPLNKLPRVQKLQTNRQKKTREAINPYPANVENKVIS